MRNSFKAITLFLAIGSSSVMAISTELAILEKSPYISGLTEKHKKGIELASKNDYPEAWKLLIPLAKKGDENAQFILGKMIVSSPTLRHKMPVAKQLLELAAKKNHPMALQTLEEIKLFKTVESIHESNFPKIVADERSKKILADAQLRYKKLSAAEEGLIRMVLFIDEPNPKYNQIIKDVQTLNYRFKEHMRTSVELVITLDDVKNRRFANQTMGFAPPKSGMLPDIDGVKSSAAGIKTFPSILLTGPSGNEIVTDMNTLESTVGKFYRASLKRIKR